MTMNEIIIVVTAFITYVFGVLSKRFNWLESQYIPIQNLLIGIIAGLLVYFSDLNNNLISSIIVCCAAALTAGGAYDLRKAGKNDKR